MTTRHPDYAILAARIAISNLHKETKKTFASVVDDLFTYSTSISSRFFTLRSRVLTQSSTVNPKNGRPSPMISEEVHDSV